MEYSTTFGNSALREKKAVVSFLQKRDSHLCKNDIGIHQK